MATQHPGGWNTLKVKTSQTEPENTTFEVLGTNKNAIHSSLIYNPSFSGTLKWRVLFWRADMEEVDYVKTRIWNPNYEDPYMTLPSGAQRITVQNVEPWTWPNPNLDPLPRLFCAGSSFLPDGRLLVVGGHLANVTPFGRGSRYSYIFDVFESTEGEWIYATVDEGQHYPQLMTHGRWYPTVTTLPNGKMLAMSGYKENEVDGDLQINRVPSIYDPSVMLWSDFPEDAEMPDEFIVDYDPGHSYPGITYPAGHVVPRGEYAGHIIYSAPQPHAWMFNPDPTLEKDWWHQVTFDERDYNHDCCTVMLHIGADNNDVTSKVLTIGGFVNGAASNAVQMLLMDQFGIQWMNLDPLTFARAHANAILLPDGRVLIVGGNTNSSYWDPVLSAEIFDPETGVCVPLPEMQFQRTYHSSAVLLPDGRVWVSGGDFKLPTDGGIVRQMNNSEIYTPGYLLEGTRPTIISCDETLGYDHGFNFTTNMIIEKAILISPGANTHAFDHHQRAVYVEITGYSQSGANYNYSAIAPHDTNVAPPGIYMLFAVLPKSESSSGLTSIPSVAKFVSLS